MTARTDPPQLFIGGEVPPAAKIFPVFEAATGSLLGDGPCATESDIDAAVAAAHSVEAQRWRASEPDERAKVMKRFAAALRVQADRTAQLGRREHGQAIAVFGAGSG